MVLPNYTDLSAVRQEILDNNLRAKAIIMDITNFRGTLLELETLNEAGRDKLAALRRCIDQMDVLARDETDSKLTEEVEKNREQYAKTLQAFRKANITTMLEIEKSNKEELFAMRPEASEVRQRKLANAASGSSKTYRSSSLLLQQESVTDRMIAISKQLHDTTQKSAATLDMLVTTSGTVESTRDELLNTAGKIHQSRKLLQKYSRRDCTDKILAIFGLLMFLASVFYVLWKRLF
ncbi:vesicle transport protein SEC20 isoform X2 [Anopheles stephensi]|uniref:Sec20 C-terminal domain-containing protein n=2 Tax=Anopheles stephensi TaxID=30069 RepID=A0A182XY20_ANOST|nr:vesicle transport protein SEC20 isoform X2 [Anopheles stephensi]XP_035900828.1 vesicle transport protein SEC20 isoform X2 [Anopheles stephensi]XP_035900837.1 vesicle transport protein SEC20 isoform X2 [Anopheles stephensi]XP_035900845.1 vesicle transport protein SEC20 isoform X2 [Anopheles stephensi]XP_035900853.1 vesicle transport protein SEC20 isoform X2 [Anopheles stephensi]XP_035900864.1 vesicle transport protein SEC20 isoform X2 [Anopheles stephensi]